jgi:Clp amino terminal domain, pathogenicity island component
MAIDMGGPGIPGFGYGNQTQSEPRADNDHSAQQQPQPAPETKAAQAASASQAGNGAADTTAAQPDDKDSIAEKQEEFVEVVPLDFDYAEPVPGYETSASDCLNHAFSIARNLKHAVLSSDHLMLALTMDQGARRLLDRAADVARLREVAMRRLGRLHSRYSAGEPAQTSDLDDIRRAARAAAAEREQLVAISDLVNAFPKESGRLTYASKKEKEPPLVETIEKGLVPRVSDAISRIEAVVREAAQGQRQTVQDMLMDLNAQHSRDEQRQREFMDEIHRQVREAVDIQLSAAFQDLDNRVAVKLAELAPPKPEPVPEPVRENAESEGEPDREFAEPAPSRRSYWTWGIL